MTKQMRVLLDFITDKPKSLDEIIAETGLDQVVVVSLLCQLDMQNRIVRLPEGMYKLKHFV